MRDLDVNLEQVRAWFPNRQEATYAFVEVSPQNAAAWATLLANSIRRCYLTDSRLWHSANTLGRTQEEVIAAALPDPGSTMAGDFGELAVYLYQGAFADPNIALGATKWRLKQDRNKPAPFSDVVHFVVPEWPLASQHDVILCAEVKTKSTNGDSKPITGAIKDCLKDRTSRLAKTLSWLRDRALTADLGDIQLGHLERFINATEHPAAQKRFHAVAVICASLVNAELVDVPDQVPADYTLIVFSVPDLRDTYMAVFAAARQAVVAGNPQATAAADDQ